MEFVVSQILGIAASIMGLLSLQQSDVKKVLIYQFLCNTVGAVSYILVGGLSGCGIYFVAVVQTVIFYLFRQKEKKPPMYLGGVFAAAFLACSLMMYRSPVDLFSAAAALTCALALSQEKMYIYRIFILLNGILWMIYDVQVGAYAMMASHILTVLSAVIGIIRLDVRKGADGKK